MIYHNTTGDGPYDGYDLNGFAETVSQTVSALRSQRREFDAIVVQGLSGIVVGAPVALRLRKPLVILRKETDDPHQQRWETTHYKWINETKLGRRALFLDDFISGGSTLRRVEDAVTSRGAQLVAKYLYRDDEYAHHTHANNGEATT